MAHIKNSLLQVALVIPTTVFAADFTGRVVGVINGDTIEVLNDHHTERIRLRGIDCPEKEQILVTLCGGRPLYSLTAVWFFLHPYGFPYTYHGSKHLPYSQTREFTNRAERGHFGMRVAS